MARSLICCLVVALSTISFGSCNGSSDLDALTNELAMKVLRQCRKTSPESYAPECVGSWILPNSWRAPGAYCNVTLIKMEITVADFYGTDDVEETMTFAGSVTFSWPVYCPDVDFEYDYTGYIEQPWLFWKPHINHQTSLDNFEMSSGFATRFMFGTNRDKNINFIWQRHGVFASICGMDFALFPFDTQECDVNFRIMDRIESVSFNENDLLWTLSGDWMVNEDNWQFVNSTYTIDQVFMDKANRSAATMSMTFRRNPAYYVFNLMIPAFALTSLQLPGIMMLPTMPDRPVFAVTILLTLTFLEGSVLSKVPVKPQRLFIGNYMDGCIYFSWGCTTYALLSLSLARGWKPYFEHEFHLTRRYKWMRISRARLLDIAAWCVGFGIFSGLQSYAISTARTTGYLK